MREYLHMEAGIQTILSNAKSVPGTTIRPTVPEDAIILGRLYAEAYFELMDQLPPPRSKTLKGFTETMSRLFIKTSNQKQHQAFGVVWNVFKWIAEYSGCPVGFLVTGVTDDHGYVGEIGVLPSHRRKGIAKALLQGFACFCKEKGIKIIKLDVNVRNTPAISLYESCGFKKIRRWCSQDSKPL